MGIDTIEVLSKKYPKCTFIVSHMSDKVREAFKNIKIKNVIVPNDGDIIEIKEIN